MQRRKWLKPNYGTRMQQRKRKENMTRKKRKLRVY